MGGLGGLQFAQLGSDLSGGRDSNLNDDGHVQATNLKPYFLLLYPVKFQVPHLGDLGDEGTLLVGVDGEGAFVGCGPGDGGVGVELVASSCAAIGGIGP